MSRWDHCAKTAMRPTRWFCCMLCGLMLASGCLYAGDTKKNSSYKAAKNVKLSAAELSARNQSLLAVYSAEIETAADRIISGSPSHAARKQALVWKAEAIPVMQTSLLNTDPIAAALDTWAFIFQMKAFMQQPALKETMAEFNSVVDETLKNMEAQMERLVQTAAPNANLADVRQKVRSWADEHPIQDSLASRQSADADVIKRVGQINIGTLGAVKELADSMGDLSARLNSYNLYVPKQARWQAELFLEDLKSDPQVNSALSDAGELAKAAASVDSQRQSMQAFVHQERVQTLEALQQQRIGILAGAHAERLGAFADLHKERIGAAADLHREQQAVLSGLRDHEVAVVNDVKAASEQELQTLGVKSQELIDRLFIRAVELMLLTLVSFALVAWILLRWFLQRQSPIRPSDLSERTFHRAA